MKLSARGSQNPHSGIREMFDRAASLEDVVNLGVGEPDFSTPRHIVDAAIEGLKKGETKYTPNAGVYSLRKAIAEKLVRENDISGTMPDNITITSGACEAITLALFVLSDPGDEILIADPSWPNYIGQITASGSKAVMLPTSKKERFHIQPAVVDKTITSRTKGIILNSPSNPTGAVLSKEELVVLAEIFKKNSIFVISDEPYEKLVYDEARHFSIGSFPSMKDYVITINSFSKSYAMTGWRVGYICSPPHVASAIAKMQENFSSCVNAAAQCGALEAIIGAQEPTKEMRDSYNLRRSLIVKGLNKIPGFICPWPEGAFYVFPDISALGLNSNDFALKLLESERVVTVPGTAFGICGEGHIRMSFAASEENIREALKRISNFVAKLRPF